ncbi:peptide/nickel transport system ATP-binding protein [Evansella vedderi]|uniref:Peptide/nickel transport system ATP-binding protein n=1 Tax=Evansella vedderi TaxID=38282 RepID=A0ABU0A100_9BACI|nr:ATP-binding cassette domain-containing protein [Evansella vedderi]MDQ0256692.1 peptide/nickel transport system ATP-binding protein [Evansella vedderi]
MQLEARNVSFRYRRKKWLFRDINLTVQPGEVVGLAGPSGCGKTTLARILAGYEKPSNGTVLFNDAPLPKTGYHPIQLVFQHPEKAINPKWPMKAVLEEAGNLDVELLERLGIQENWLQRWPNELSGGELQRFCIARALGPGTQFLIADEMTTMLDTITQAQIWHGVMDIVRNRNIGIIIISHDTVLLKRLVSRYIDFPLLNKDKVSY